MNSHVSFITLGVEDLDRTKQFYGQGLGWPIQVSQGQYVAFKTAAAWGGYFGHFADPDGNLWKIVAGEGDQPYSE